MNDEKEFIYTDSSDVEHKITLSDSSFKFANKDSKIHDTKFLTKPTTFFKDAFKRFCKNKSSVAGGIILGLLLVLSLVLPVAIQSDLSQPHPEETFLLPKLFPSGTGFWDGTERINDVPVDPSTRVQEEDGNYYGYPFEYQYPRRSVINRSPIRVGYVDSNQPLSTIEGGYLNLINLNAVDMSVEEPSFITITYSSPTYDFDLNQIYNLEFNMLGEDVTDYPEGNYSVYISYNATLLSTTENGDEEEAGETNVPNGPQQMRATLVDFDETKDYERHTIPDDVDPSQNVSIKTLSFEDILAVIRENDEIDFEQPITDIKINIDLEPNIGTTSSLFIRSISLYEEGNEEPLSPISWSDANANILLASSNPGYWSTTGSKYLYHGIGYVCDITYDSYQDVYGEKEATVNNTQMAQYVANQWLKEDVINEDVLQNWYRLTIASGGRLINDPNSSYYTFYQQVNEEFQSYILDNSLLPIVDILGVSRTSDGTNRTYSFTCIVSGYKLLNYESMPMFVAGTDRYGYDFLKRVFEGIRNSLLIGIAVFLICFSFGLVYGAIEGYFGGNVDIFMQRFTDLLSGIPWIVIMTLCVLNLGSNIGTFILAMCLTGWIGTSSLTRTQFYRFRGREYTLASRTLGASNMRLIFRHILPNSIGTIITSAVLMIPSVIFSEATISYLGLGFQDIQSLGVILSENQRYLTSNPYLILFPSIIMALIMISFNLFGNGLRDAFNPSLKGSD